MTMMTMNDIIYDDERVGGCWLSVIDLVPKKGNNIETGMVLFTLVYFEVFFKYCSRELPRCACVFAFAFLFTVITYTLCKKY
jgi:hypothetical protein